MLRKALRTSIVYTDTIKKILMHIQSLGMQIYPFSMKITRFDITRVGKFVVKENRIDMNYGRSDCGDHAELSGKLKVYFISSADEGMCITAKMIVKYPNMFQYDVYIKGYIYAYLKCMIENDDVIKCLYPGSSIELPKDIYRDSDWLGLDDICYNDTDIDKDIVSSVFSDK